MGRRPSPLALLLGALLVLQGCGPGRADDPPPGRQGGSSPAGAPDPGASAACRDLLAAARILRGKDHWICDLPCDRHPRVRSVRLTLPGGGERIWRRQEAQSSPCVFELPLTTRGPLVLSATDQEGRSARRSISL